MPKKNRVAIYEYLFKEGVMVAKKDYHAPKHPELEMIPNLEVIKAMQVKIRNYSFGDIFVSFRLFINFTRISFPVLEIQRICKGTICMEAFLLVSYERWY